MIPVLRPKKVFSKLDDRRDVTGERKSNLRCFDSETKISCQRYKRQLTKTGASLCMGPLAKEIGVAK